MSIFGGYIQLEPGEELSRVQYYSFKRTQDDGEVEFLITVREFDNPKMGNMRFFAQSDKQTNQKLAPYTPAGWGNDINAALADCIRAIRKFPYQGE